MAAWEVIWLKGRGHEGHGGHAPGSEDSVQRWREGTCQAWKALDEGRGLQPPRIAPLRALYPFL